MGVDVGGTGVDVAVGGMGVDVAVGSVPLHAAMLTANRLSTSNSCVILLYIFSSFEMDFESGGLGGVSSSPLFLSLVVSRQAHNQFPG